MEAGRELDELIAKVMGWTEHQGGIWTRLRQDTSLPPASDARASSPPPYSTDISWAWEVAEKMGLSTLEHEPGYDDTPWFCKLSPRGMANGKTVPHAICLAALKVVGAG